MQPKRLVLISITSLFHCGSAFAQPDSPSALNPKQYKSPSGKFSLMVDPSDLYGRGGADYRVSKDGTVIWEGQKQFTLHDAGITDEGLIGGYGYTHGIDGHFRASGNDGPGKFHVVIMRATGEVLLNDVSRRSESSHLHTPPSPLAKGMLVDGAKDRLFVVLSDENRNRREDSWWTYALSSAKRLSKSRSGPEIPVTAQTPEANPLLPVFPTQPLKLLGRFTLRDGIDATPSPIRDIVGFDFNDRGQFGFVRSEALDKFTFVLVTQNGTLVSETPLVTLNAPATTNRPKAAWVEGDRWVVISSALGVGGKASAWWLDISKGKLMSIVGFDSPSIDQIVSSRDGGFVALATYRFQNSMEDQLIAFDRNGRARWNLKQNYGDRAGGLFSPEDITVTTDKRIAVVDNIRHTIQFFSLNGKFQSSIKLDDVLGRKANYPSEITADNKGGVVIKDFNGRYPIVRLDARGKLASQFQPKHPDGRIIEAVRGQRVDPSGRVWVCDGECFLRLSDEGVEAGILGAAPKREILNRIATLTVDQRGRLYAVDDRTGVVHVYDQSGSRLRICKPDPSDIKGKLVRAQVAVRADGTVFFNDGEDSRSASYVQYDPDGHRVGTKEFGLDTIKEDWYAIPNSSQFLAVGYHDAFLVGPNGKVARSIKRRPDRNWLDITRAASVAPNGSFAILSGGGHWLGTPWHINLYDAAGSPVRTITLPVTFMDSCFAHAGGFLATRTESDICIFKSTGEPLLRFSPPIENFKDIRNEQWTCFATHEGRELWLAALGRKTVWRFELPQP